MFLKGIPTTQNGGRTRELDLRLSFQGEHAESWTDEELLLPHLFIYLLFFIDLTGVGAEEIDREREGNTETSICCPTHAFIGSFLYVP